MKRKRKYRQLDDETKKKISNTMRGKTKTDSHKAAISNGMKAYWRTIPSKNNEQTIKNNETNM